MSQRGATSGLFTDALQQPLATCMLPVLGAKDLGRLACVCRAGRELVSQAFHSLWREVAAEVLPPRHPVRNSVEVNANPGSEQTLQAPRADLAVLPPSKILSQGFFSLLLSTWDWLLALPSSGFQAMFGKLAGCSDDYH